MSGTRELIDNILSGDLVAAKKSFEGVVASNIEDALETERVRVSGKIFNEMSDEDFELNENPEHGYKVKKDGDKYCVVDAKTGEKYGNDKFDSREKAQSYINNMKEETESDSEELNEGHKEWIVHHTTYPKIKVKARNSDEATRKAEKHHKASGRKGGVFKSAKLA